MGQAGHRQVEGAVVIRGHRRVCRARSAWRRGHDSLGRGGLVRARIPRELDRVPWARLRRLVSPHLAGIVGHCVPDVLRHR